MKSNLPIIRIKNAGLLRENASQHLHELWGEGKGLASHEWIDGKVLEYRKAWDPYEEKILASMIDTLGVSFKQNIIDVYIAPWFQAFSDPLVIGVMYEPDTFVDILTHELLHRLLNDNVALTDDSHLVADWKKLFGDEHELKTLVHIPVHALHKAIYLDILNEPARLKRDMANCKKYGADAYVAAWDYVDSRGYQKIVEQLQDYYKRTNSESR